MSAKDIFSRIWNGYESGELLAMCAWCGRIRIDGVWLAPPLTALATIDQTNSVSHSICEGCLEAVASGGALRQQPAG